MLHALVITSTSGETVTKKIVEITDALEKELQIVITFSKQYWARLNDYRRVGSQDVRNWIPVGTDHPDCTSHKVCVVFDDETAEGRERMPGTMSTQS